MATVTPTDPNMVILFSASALGGPGGSGGPVMVTVVKAQLIMVATCRVRSRGSVK